jgi:ribonuclease/clavin/mitogillin
MRESVSAVFVTNEKVFFVKRQNYLPVFPGYHAAPGGKVDKTDSSAPFPDSLWPRVENPQVLHALIREIKEELNFDLIQAIESKEVLSIDYIGLAITPEFNPYRFKNYYFKITLSHEMNFDLDSNEAEYGEWNTPLGLHQKYKEGRLLAVPPAIILLEALVANLGHSEAIDMSLPHDPETEVAMIESIHGVRQFLPLSNTFPPANRTNSFIIGDGGESSRKLLIDPSPKDESELKKFLKSIDKIGFDSIFLTHHHPDHCQYVREIALLYGVGIELSADTAARIKINKGDDYFDDIPLTFRSEGDIVTKSLGQNIRVYEVPGHDEGQLALAPENLNWFLVGDLIQTIGTVVIQAPEGDMKKYFHSLNRVIALNPKNIIPSHGIIIGGTNKLIETLTHRQMREDSIIKLLSENKSEEEMLAIIYEGLAPELLPYALRTIKAHLKKINEDRLENF